jgi:hypothetical protein
MAVILIGVVQLSETFFNTIKHATEQRSQDGGVFYTRGAFTHAFDNANAGSAVVASRSAAHPVLALNQDHRLEV